MTPILQLFATERHFVDHLAPIWRALPATMQGGFHVTPQLVAHARRRDVRPTTERIRRDRPVLIASYGDLKRVREAGARTIAYLEHGAGQSYTRAIPNYGGGRSEHHADIGLYLVPNERNAARWRGAWPQANVEVVGCPKLDTLPTRGEPGVVAISFHFEATIADEARSAFQHHKSALRDLARSFTLIGHGHPRAIEGAPHLRDAYAAAGIELVEDFEDVCARASVYVCDNSSTIFEFAATGRPVVLMNAPWYSRGSHHGLRFWDAAHVGIHADDPADLPAAIELALTDPPEVAAAREDAVGIAYGHRGDATRRAVTALVAWMRAGQARSAA